MAGVLLVWWLIQAPLRIDFAKPAVESAIARQTGLHAEIGHLALAWQGMGTPLEIQLSDVTVQNKQGDTGCHVPECGAGPVGTLPAEG